MGLLGETEFWTLEKLVLLGESRTSEDCDLESGENEEGGAAVDLLGEVGFWIREVVLCWDCGISE